MKISFALFIFILATLLSGCASDPSSSMDTNEQRGHPNNKERIKSERLDKANTLGKSLGKTKYNRGGLFFESFKNDPFSPPMKRP